MKKRFSLVDLHCTHGICSGSLKPSFGSDIAKALGQFRDAQRSQLRDVNEVVIHCALAQILFGRSRDNADYVQTAVAAAMETAQEYGVEIIASIRRSMPAMPSESASSAASTTAIVSGSASASVAA